MYELEEPELSQENNCGVESNFWMNPNPTVRGGATIKQTLARRTVCILLYYYSCWFCAQRNVQVHSFSTCSDVNQEVLAFLGLNKGEHHFEYGLYEVFGDLGTNLRWYSNYYYLFSAERMIWPQERICDIIAKWETYKRNVEQQGLNSSFHILFKQQLFLNPKEEINEETRALLTFNSVLHELCAFNN